MTDRERFNKQMNYQAVDRCVNMEFGYWDENFQQWPLFKDNGIKNNWDAHFFLGFDGYRACGTRLWMIPPFEHKVIKETETHRILRNEDGLLAEVPKDGHSTIPHFLESSIKTPDDWKQCKEERFRVDDPARIVDIEKLQKANPPDRIKLLAVDCGSLIGKIRDMLTMEGLSYAVHDYPDMVEDMVETCCVMIEHSLDQILPHVDVDFATGWEDISCNSGPLISMDFFEKVILPRYKRIGKKLREGGVDIWWTDCDGDIRPFVPFFLEAGLNTMFPFEVNGSGHPGELLDKYGKDLRIVGGIDKMALREGKDATKKYLESLVPYVERGGFIPHCDHRCPPDVAPDNYIYYLDLKEKMFGMK